MRIQPPELTAVLETGKYSKRNIVLFDMPSGFYGFWNHTYDTTIDGHTIKSLPGEFQVSAIKSSMDMSIEKVTVTFGGLDPRVSMLIDEETYHRRPVRIFRAVIDPSTDKVVGITQWFSGVIDTVPTSEQVGGPTTLTVNIDSDDWELNRSGTRVRTNGDQRQIDSLDGSYAYTTSAIAKPIWWGRAGPVNPKDMGTSTTGTGWG